MTPMTLVIGDKNLSSWSLRPYLVLKQVGVPFDEVHIPLHLPGTREKILPYSRAGRVPVLLHGELTIWDSLAICEYLNDLFPEKALWPSDARTRAVARSISAEMHSGFPALRETLSMRCAEAVPTPRLSEEVSRDIDRVKEIWTSARRQYGGAAPFLFGGFTIADAMFAPVVTRFRTYGISVGGEAGEYANAIWKLPAMQQWMEGAKRELAG